MKPPPTNHELGTQEKRLVNRLSRALATGKVTRREMKKIGRAISLNTNEVQQKKRTSGYIEYYAARYQAVRDEMPKATLGDMAKVVARDWKSLSEPEKDKWKEKAKIENDSQM